MVESSTPAMAADVAAPIRKLWPAYWEAQHGQYPTDFHNELLIRERAIRGFQEEWALLVSLSRYVAQNCGHRSQPVLLRTTSTPWPNWSVLDWRRRNRSIFGSKGLSMTMSPHERCSLGLKSDGDKRSSSPSRKKAVQQTAHSTRLSGCADRSNSSFILRSKTAVTGRRTREAGATDASQHPFENREGRLFSRVW